EQETYRRGSLKKHYDALDSIIEERAAREIYLKPFEMIVRSTNVSTIMTSFNKINGIFAAQNKDLCIGILREEWGYQGMVVTDWGDMDIVVNGANAVASGNDIIMPGGPPVIQQILIG
ncbi:MAG TPA: beta-glucosidase, partial [Lachnospiraceae bacterium]|nr:beta-glucosidase [Lachnospiraceae bacterium]